MARASLALTCGPKCASIWSTVSLAIDATAQTQAVPTLQTRVQRLRALDQMRGVVMVLMTIDHASDLLNDTRFVTDAASLWEPGSPIPAGQFLLRWITHLCAPTFVFLAGVSIALSSQKRLARGEPEGSITRALVGRGLFIALLDPLWMSPIMMEGEGVLFQVLYAIGISMVLMAWLRRLPRWLLLTLGAGFCVASELCSTLLRSGGSTGLLAALLVTPGRFPLALGPLHVFLVAYPALPWLALMMLGFGCAHWLAERDDRGLVERRLRYAGLATLGVFVAVRAHNGYGNMGLLRDNAALLQWLHVSKYPPSLSYVTLELGLMALLLSVLYRVDRDTSPTAVLAWPLRGLTVLGRAALFYYVLHIHVMALITWLTGTLHQGGIAASLVGAAIALALLSYPVARYQRHKATHPSWLTRYL